MEPPLEPPVGALEAAPRRLAMLFVRNRQTNRILVNVTSADRVSLITLAQVLQTVT